MELETTNSQTISTTLTDNFITPISTGRDLYMVTDLYNTTDKRPVRRISKRKMQRLNPTETGKPRLWCPVGSLTGVGYRIYPIPSTSSQQITVREYSYYYPLILSTDSQEPVIPDEWHPVIWMMAAAEGALLLDWTEKEQEMEGKAKLFIASRKSPYEEASFAGGRTHFNVRV